MRPDCRGIAVASDTGVVPPLQLGKRGEVNAKPFQHFTRDACASPPATGGVSSPACSKAHVLGRDKLIVTPDIHAIHAGCLLVTLFKRDKSATLAVSSDKKAGLK